MKVSELTGAKLDYWAARADGKPNTRIDGSTAFHDVMLGGKEHPKPYAPSTDWCDGGPIIEREGITPVFWEHGDWGAFIGPHRTYIDEYRPCDDYGPVKGAPTALIAAMRAYVASKFGDNVPDNE